MSTIPKPLTWSLIQMIQAVEACQLAGCISDRNKFCQDLFKTPWHRHLIIGARSIETWWDSQSKNWITQVKNVNGDDVEDVVYSGHKHDAAVVHVWACQRAIVIALNMEGAL